MKNKEKVIFIAIGSLSLLILCIRFFSDNNNLLHLRNEKDNPAETVVFTGPSKIKAGTKELKEGYYDIYASEKIITNYFSLRKGQSLKNVIFYKDTVLESDLNISFELKKSTFAPIIFKKRKGYLKNTSGTFKVGHEIDEGDYTISLKANQSNGRIFIQILNENLNEITSHTITAKDSASIKLRNDEFLSIYNMNYNLGDFEIEIEKHD